MLIRDEETKLKINGRTFQLNLSFDCVLAFYEALNSEDLEDFEAVDLGLKIFVKNDVGTLSYAAKFKVLQQIFKQFINNDKAQKNKPTMDYIQDQSYIYASFLQAYGIDLTEQRGKMSWQKFKALIEGLPSNTKLREVIEIRARKIPKRTKHNSEEINSIIALKRHYALRIKTKSNYQESANDLFEILKAQASR